MKSPPGWCSSGGPGWSLWEVQEAGLSVLCADCPALLSSEIQGTPQLPDPKELCATASPAHCSCLLLMCPIPLHLQEQLDHPTG